MQSIKKAGQGQLTYRPLPSPSMFLGLQPHQPTLSEVALATHTSVYFPAGDTGGGGGAGRHRVSLLPGAAAVLTVWALVTSLAFPPQFWPPSSPPLPTGALARPQSSGAPASGAGPRHLRVGFNGGCGSKRPAPRSLTRHPSGALADRPNTGCPPSCSSQTRMVAVLPRAQSRCDAGPLRVLGRQNNRKSKRPH